MSGFSPLKIYFFGSGRIAIPVLSELVKSEKIRIAGVGTQKDKPSGREKKLRPTPVGEWVEKNGISADKPESVNSPEFMDNLKKIKPDMILLVSFGQILREEILTFPPLGCINVHASLLPKYRGASPVAAAILNEDRKTGISFMKMEKGLDSGPVYCSFECQVPAGIKADRLEDELGILAAANAADVLSDIASEKIQPEIQDHSKASFAVKIKKEDGEINWNESAELIERKSRAYHPWPGIYFCFNHLEKKIRISVTELSAVPDLKGEPGEVLLTGKNDWIIACAEGAVSLRRVIPQGKKEMSGAEFVRGCPGLQGKILSKHGATVL